MAPIDEALAELVLYDKPNISATARKYEIDRSTLSRRFRGVTVPAADAHQNLGLLSPIQERRLIKYLNELSERSLPPTPAMLRNFVCEITHQEPGKCWTSRFIKKHRNELLSRYLNPIDFARQKADSLREYTLWFDGLQKKIAEYSVLPENQYNMDEKGFLIGMLGKARRVYTKSVADKKKLLGNVQDGSREWITIIPTICADGTSLPPALIYQALTGNIQDTWLQDFDSTKHAAFFASSPSGWTNDELGYQWLTTVFDRFTKEKARHGRNWRLLILDGHGSHINMKFLNYCNAHRILVFVYPPHSTHRLQPLDVSLFAPLAIYYSQELDQFIHRSQGISSISKRNFFKLFWPAYQKAFTAKNIVSAWLKTGIYPLDPTVILGALEPSNLPSEQSDLPPEERPSSGSSSANTAISHNDWRKLRAMVNDVVAGQNLEKEKKLLNTVVGLSTDNALLKARLEGLEQALNDEKKKRKRGKGLFEELRAIEGQGAMFFSPNRIEQAKGLQQEREDKVKTKKQEKAAKKAAKKAAQLAKQLQIEERKVNRERQRQERIESAAVKRLVQEHLKIDKQATAQLQDDIQSNLKTGRKACRPQKTTQTEPLQLEVHSNQEAGIRSSRVTGRAIQLPVRYRD
ncbi:MAG TPA: transposase [Chlamydiales bacterium]|nr:transposase [Chlamydiales bacterium]